MDTPKDSLPDLALQTTCPSTAQQSSSGNRRILHQLDPNALVHLSHPFRSCSAVPTTALQNVQGPPLLSISGLQGVPMDQGNGELTHSFKGQLPSQPMLNASESTNGWDPHHPAEGMGSEYFAHGQDISQEIVPSFDGDRLPIRSFEGWPESPHPNEAEADLTKDAPVQGTSTNGGIDMNAFRAVTCPDEEEKRRMVGTLNETDFPEIPDIFLNSQDYINDFGEYSQPTGNIRLGGNDRSDRVWDTQSSIRCRRPVDVFGTNTPDDFQQAPQETGCELDVFMQDSSNIVSQLGNMPVSSFNAFLDGDDVDGVNSQYATGYVNDISSDHNGVPLNTLEGNNLLENVLNPDNSAPEISYEEAQEANGFDSREIITGSNLGEGCWTLDLHNGANADGNEVHGDMVEDELPHRPVSASLMSDPPFGGINSDYDEGHDCNMHIDQGDSHLNDLNDESRNISQDKANGADVLTDQGPLWDLTNHQMGHQLSVNESNYGTVPSRSANLKDIWREVSEFNKKVNKQNENRGQQLVNLKYYSLKRMEKDLTDNVVISQKLLIASKQLCEERRRLKEECQKEREEIERLRKLLGK